MNDPDQILLPEENYNAFEDLKEFDSGNLAFEFSKKIQELNKLVLDRKKPGQITLKLTIKPNPDFGEYAITVIPEIGIKLPIEKCQFSMRYLTKDGKMIKEDPNQMIMKGILKS